MSDFTRRTLRLWAYIAGLHGLVLIMTASLLVPWKTPWVNGVAPDPRATDLHLGLALYRRAMALLAGALALLAVF